MLSDMNYGRAKRIAATMDHNSVSQTELFDGLLDSDPVKRKWIIFLELKVKWRLSEYGKSSAKTIKGILKRKDTVVTQAMCLGLGAMDYDTDECTYCFNQGDCDQGCYKQARSFAQLAAFSSWVDLLKTKVPNLRIYLQDPRFKEDDVRFLRMLGYTVFIHDLANAHLNATTFLYAPCVPWNVAMPMFAHVHPAIYIGNDWHSLTPPTQTSRNRSASDIGLAHLLQQANIRTFYESRASFAIEPDQEEDYEWWLTINASTKIYWKARPKEKRDKEVRGYYRRLEEVDIDAEDLFPPCMCPRCRDEDGESEASEFCGFDCEGCDVCEGSSAEIEEDGDGEEGAGADETGEEDTEMGEGSEDAVDMVEDSVEWHGKGKELIQRWLVEI